MNDRRAWLIIAVSLAISAVLFRPFVADALVSRGDEFLRAGDLGAASIYYARAVRADPDSEPAAERFTFVGFRLGGAELRAVLTFADAYLSRHPSASSVRLDRAFALRAAGMERTAAREFLVLGHERRDFRYFGLAAHAAMLAGRPDLARYAFARALALNPRYAIASQALKQPAR